MTVRNHRAEKSRITIVLPQNTQEDLSSVQEGIRDYAYDHQIKLDVWYKKQMSEKSFAELVKEEKQNRSMGILLVYPEFYLKKNQNGYKYKEVLALTDTMKESFLHMRHLCGGNRKKKHTGCQSVKLFWDRSKVAVRKWFIWKIHTDLAMNVCR